MRPIFTIHAGEYLVATEIEQSFPRLRVWIPSKDIGIDMLITDAQQNKIASLQIKFSKDYLATDKRSVVTSEVESGGWWTLKREKIRESPADLWVMVLYQFHTRRFDFVVIPPRDLLSRYDAIGATSKTIQSYIWVTKHPKHRSCWETRGLKNHDLQRVCGGTYQNSGRDLTQYLNAWPFSSKTHS